MKKILVIFIVLVVGLSVGLFLKLRAQRLEAERAAGGSATIEGTEVDVVARLPVRIEKIHADEGDRVEAGQLLVELECDEQRALLAQAEAAVAGAETALAGARVSREMAEQNVVTVQRQRKAAEAAVEASRSQKRALSVKAKAARRASKRIQRVHAGGAASEQVLDRVETEARGLKAQLGALSAGVNVAGAQAEVVAATEETASVQVKAARLQIEAAEKQLLAARAGLDRAKVAVRECRLTAPITGIVQSRNFEVGEVVMPGSRVLTLVDLSEVEATFYVPNAELAVAEPGRAVRVVADAWPGASFEGAIRRVSTTAEFTPRNVQTREDRDRLVYAVEVRIPNPEGKLRPGMPVEVEIPGTELGGSAE